MPMRHFARTPALIAVLSAWTGLAGGQTPATSYRPGIDVTDYAITLDIPDTGVVIQGDVVVSFAGKSDFRSVPHFHAWVSLTRTAGEDTEFVVMRGKERLELRYLLPE